MTKEEKHLWYDFLRSYPVRFSRQKVLGKYIADFYSAEAKLVIELDGNGHYTDEAIEYDKKIIVGVITASPRKEIEQQCRARGADFFLEKNNDWQAQLTSIMAGYINEGKEDEDDW